MKFVRFVSSINLRHGVASNESSVTCSAAAGTYLLEFGTLSRLVIRIGACAVCIDIVDLY